jgi:hypothetical protein
MRKTMMAIKFLLITILATSCSWLESDYDKLMNPIKEMKLAEKKAGKPNPTYDGVVEPDFPDEKLNDETLEGVDSNKDGVRDDMEIWINRVAEDEYVRLSLKHFYSKYWLFNISVWNEDPLALQNKKSWEKVAALVCLNWMLKPYEADNFSKNIEKDRMYYDLIEKLSLNTPKRKEIIYKVNSYNGNEGSHGQDDLHFCHPKIDKKYINELENKFIKRNGK